MNRYIYKPGTTVLSIMAEYLGIVSLSLIISSVVIVPTSNLIIIAMPFGPLCVVISLLALQEFRKNPKKIGEGRAILGLALGLLSSIIIVYLLYVAFTDRPMGAPSQWSGQIELD
jgi:hypothetical protein